MSDAQIKMLEELRNAHQELGVTLLDYWQQYSGLNTIQFWINLIMLLAPLVILYMKIDRSRALLLGFFGFNVHTWFTYIDNVGVRFGFWSYPYQAIPFLPVHFGLDAALIPVSFMLLYQYCLNHEKNFYVFALGLCAGLSFVFKPYLVIFNLFQLHNGANYFYLFVFYLIIVGLAIVITNLFLHFEKTTKKNMPN
ncbi:CBO0543 family protein [Halalkalibacter krulwichiae]|uniref:Uncharacterized protein n=1 Tax=Halalkalibacter krulwichiae TaxID=199441 RepID=A0A1X9MER7_9BACI|nr:CBO0543 family protein [Halalkalibacter krulwichiae]ARK31939.1 hypothetical protein BkAM31D_19990 [Halalkalibacter krulwichiae]